MSRMLQMKAPEKVVLWLLFLATIVGFLGLMLAALEIPLGEGMFAWGVVGLVALLPTYLVLLAWRVSGRQNLKNLRKQHTEIKDRDAAA